MKKSDVISHIREQRKIYEGFIANGEKLGMKPDDGLRGDFDYWTGYVDCLADLMDSYVAEITVVD